jgi:hypothetical protein
MHMNQNLKFRALAAAAMLVASGSSLAQASGVARVTNQAWGYYYADTSLNVNIGGVDIGSYNSTQWFINQYGSNFGTSAALAPAPVSLSATDPGNLVTSPSTVTMDLRAGTTWGANHTYASISGFDPYLTSATMTLCPTVPGSQTCIPGLPEQTQTLSSSNQTYGYATSRWEEIYQTGGGSGALSTTFNVHVSLGAQPSGTGTPNGNAQFFWAERDFAGNYVAYFSAGYDAGTDSWSASTYSNTTGQYHYFNGSGSLTIGDSSNPTTLTSGDSSTFDGSITGLRSFATGDVVYVDSYAQSYVSGNGLSDAENTVTLTKLIAPTGVRLLAGSGANYGGVFSGGGSGGGLCTTTECVIGGGGGGGGPPPVPEPQTYALLLAGLAVVGRAVKRRRAA